MKLNDKVLDELLADCESPEQIVGENFFRNWRAAEPGEQEALRRLWEVAGLSWPEKSEEEAASASAD